jgi:hypothetical protein
MTELRLISFPPSATEMAFALGLGDRFVGVSHKCDFPAAAKTKLVVIKPVLPLEKMSLREIHAAVAERIGSGQKIYQVDERLLEQLAPTHILTQDLCQVCAPSGNEITRALAALSSGNFVPKRILRARIKSTRFCSTRQQYARRCADGFRTAQWHVVLLLVGVATEGGRSGTAPKSTWSTRGTAA